LPSFCFESTAPAHDESGEKRHTRGFHKQLPTKREFASLCRSNAPLPLTQKKPPNRRERLEQKQRQRIGQYRLAA
jgi:hypothetical protein